MKIIIDGTTYTEIKNLKFDPQTDITGIEAVINGFSADIMTDDDIDVGGNAYLYDDMDNLWAKYWLVEAVRKDKFTVNVEAKSILLILDRKTMDVTMYSNTPVSSIISSIFSGLTSEYTLDPSFAGKTISGYCPKQSARERLQWVCFCIGAYLKTFFADKILIIPVNTNPKVVPMDKTYWKPSITYGNVVTAVQATVYTYRQGTPENTDTWVDVNGTYYIQTSQEFNITNPDAPITANENVVSVSNVTIINNSNISEILTLLSTYYFKRIEVDADIINNADYEAGDKIVLPVDDETLVSGFIKSENFTFGLQAKSKIKLMQTDVVESGTLHIIRRYGNLEIGNAIYLFPIGYSYTIQNIYVDLISGGNRRTVYFPLQPNATGTMSSEEVTDIEYYGIALIFYGGILDVLSVDEVESKTEDGIIIVEVS